MAKPQPSLMDKIVSLCKRRGFVYPASEIYGGIGNTYDYGPLGVELKRRVKDAWWSRVVTARRDVVGLDSAILQNPRVWEVSGHVGGFTDPMVDCKKCKARFRADKLDHARCPEKPSKHPGECDGELTEPRAFNLMFKTHVGRGRGHRLGGLPAPGDRPGDLPELQERDGELAPQAAVRHRPDRQVVPQRDHARATSCSGRASSSRRRWSSSCRRPRGDKLVRVLEARSASDWYVRPGPRRGEAAHARSRRRRALALLDRYVPTSSTSTPSAGASSRASPAAPTST